VLHGPDTGNASRGAGAEQLWVSQKSSVAERSFASAWRSGASIAADGATSGSGHGMWRFLAQSLIDSASQRFERCFFACTAPLE
jgi:hypothetical protein